MALAEDVDLEEFIMAKDDLSGADIKVPSILCVYPYLSRLLEEFRPYVRRPAYLPYENVE